MSASRKQLNLDGKWFFAADPSDCGRKEQWFERFPDDTDEIYPPFLSGQLPGDGGIGWYQHSFAAGPSWSQSSTFLHFERASYFTEIWLNGHYLGSHEGAWLPFSVPTEEHLHPDSNTLVLRIVFPEQHAGDADLNPASLPYYGETGSTGGLLGAVSLLAYPSAHIDSIFVQPDLRRARLAVDVSCTGGTAKTEIVLRVKDTDYSVTGKPGALLLPMPDFQAWTPEKPHLYRLEVLLKDGRKTVDAEALSFGMREFTLKDNRFHLNQRPLFIKARACFAAPWLSLEKTARLQTFRQFIAESRDAGFNMITLTGHPVPEDFLCVADEEGMLLSVESSLRPMTASDRLEQRCEDAVTDMIRNGRNHASLVLWRLFNEERTRAAETGNAARALSDRLFTLARELDPSRLIFAGGAHADSSDAKLLRPYRSTPEPYDDLFFCPTDPVPENRTRYLQCCGAAGKLAIISGMTSFQTAEHSEEDDTLHADFDQRGLNRIFGSLAAFNDLTDESAKTFVAAQIQAMRANSKIAGYFHAFPESSGCTSEKPNALEIVAAAQAPLLPLISLEKSNLHPREATGVTIQMIGDPGQGGSADLSLQVIGPTGQVLWKKKRHTKLPRHGQLLWSGSIGGSGALGLHRFVASLMQGTRVLGRGEDSFFVFEQAAPSPVEVHLLDPEKIYLDRVAALAKTGNLLAPLHIIPPLSNTVRAYPDNDLMQILAQVEEGAVAIVFSPPEDWNDLFSILDAKISATPRPASCSWASAFHYVKLHPVFEKLPSRCLMREVYKNVASALNFEEQGEEDISGSLCRTADALTGESTARWGNNILVQRYGTGRIVMTCMPVLEHLGKDPVADRLFVNLLNHFERRSIPSASPVPPNQRAVEWLREEKKTQLRRWMILGGIDLSSDENRKKSLHSIEMERNFEAAVEGWYRPEKWRTWFTRADADHEVPLTDALDPGGFFFSHYERSASYAYTEITCERRLSSYLRVRFHSPIRIWVNQVPVFESEGPPDGENYCIESVNATLKHGKNTLLVKCSKERGKALFALDFVSDDHLPSALKWWK